MRGQRRIEQMYAFVLTDTDGTEGVPAINGPGGVPLPLVGADWARVEDLRPTAIALARSRGVKITLCRFEIRTELEEYGGS